MNVRTIASLPALLALSAGLASVGVGAQSLTLNAQVSGYTYSIVGEPDSQTPHNKMTITTIDTPTTVQSSGVGAQGAKADNYSEGAEISAWAAAQAGSVHVRSSASAGEATPSVKDPNGEFYLPDAHTTEAQAIAAASFIDYLTVQSGTAPVGTPVTFKINFFAEGTYGLSRLTEEGNQNLLAGLDFGYFFNGTSFACEGLECALDPSDNGTISNGYGGTFSAKVGDTISLGAFAYIGDVATVDAGYLASKGNDWSLYGHVNGFVDMTDTAAVWISDVSGDTTFKSSSGFDYTVDPLTSVAAVPEPAEVTLLLGGGALLFGIRVAARIRRSARRAVARAGEYRHRRVTC